LNEPVWNAVVNAMLNPDLITQQVAESRQIDNTAAEQSATERVQTEHRLHQIASEEARLLEAYRLAVITPAQLGAELERLSARKHSLESRRDQLISELDTPSAPDIRDSVLDYCREAAANIEQFTHEEKKRFLRLLLTGIVFEGRIARISGIIPMTRGGKHNGESDDAGPEPDSSVRRIATPKVDLHELNPGSGTHFELTAEIPPIQIERFVDARGRFCRREQAEHATQRQLTQTRKRAA
jgi:hypothetical protein